MIEFFNGKTLTGIRLPQLVQLLTFIYSKDRPAPHPPITLESIVKSHQEDGEPTYTVAFNYDERHVNADDLLDSIELCPMKIRSHVIPHTVDRLIRAFPDHLDRNRQRPIANSA